TIGVHAKEAIPILLEGLKEKNPEAQVQILNAIFLIGSPDMPGYMDALREANERIPWAGPFVLPQFGPRPRDAVPALVAALKGKEPSLRLAAATALGQIGPEAQNALPALQQSLNDPEPPVRGSAAAAILKIDVNAPEATRKALTLALEQAEKEH